jgi:hypothetical protein
MTDTDTRTPQKVYENVTRILRTVFGGDLMDYDRVTDVISGYAEPGYTPADAVVVLGNWNPKRFPHSDEPPLTREENLGPRLADALTRVGAEIEWLDEWTSCSECFSAVRTAENSYSWQPSFAWTDDGPVCHNCLVTWGEDALEATEVIDNPRMCITWCEPAHVESLGFVKWEPDDPHTYASGWYPGQTDDPQAIYDEIKREHPESQVVFFLDSTGQFDMHFSAYFRTTPEEDR